MNMSPMDKTVTTSSYVASVSTAIGGWLTLSNFALFVGIVSTLILSIAQWRVNCKRSKQIDEQKAADEIRKAQDEEFHEARMKALRASKDGIPDDIIFVKGTPEPYDVPRGIDSREN